MHRGVAVESSELKNNYEKGCDLVYCDAYVNEKKMYYFDNELQALCKRDLDTYEVKVLKKYYGENRILANRVFMAQNVLYITVFDSLRILKFNMEECTFKEITDGGIVLLNSSGKTSYVFSMISDNRIWFFPRYITTLTCYFDMATEQFYWDDTLNRAIEGYVDQNEMTIVYPAEYGTQFWTVLGNTHRYLKYDLCSGEVEIFELKRHDVHLNSICYDGNKVWLTQMDSANLICMDDEECIIEIQESDIKCQYSRMINLKEDIIVLPCFGRKIVLIGKNSGAIREIEIGQMDFYEPKVKSDCSKILGCYEEPDKIYLFPWGISDLLFWDKVKRTIRKVNDGNSLVFYREHITDLLKNGVSIQESWKIKLASYIEGIYDDVINQKLGNMQNGYRIFDCVVKKTNE